MKQINVDDIRRDPNGFLDQIEKGERVIIIKEQHPIAIVNPTSRPFVLAAGEFTVPDDFDGPLPDDVLAEFEGK